MSQIINSIIDELSRVIKLPVTFSNTTPRDKSFIDVTVTSAPSTRDSESEQVNLFETTIDVSYYLITKGRALPTHLTVIDTIVSTLNDFNPKGAVNMRQYNTSGVDFAGRDGSTDTLKTTLTYTITHYLP